jgi:hypothetical protein
LYIVELGGRGAGLWWPALLADVFHYMTTDFYLNGFATANIIGMYERHEL